MIDDALLKSNYLGKDGFIWWIGQVAPAKVWDIPEKVDIVTGGSWAYRCKVRIIGYHTYNKKELPDKDLPWAQIMLGATDGSAQGGLGKSHKLVGGETVFGFFLDGDDSQQPVVIGVIHRDKNVKSFPESDIAFQPFEGNDTTLGSTVAQGQTKIQPTVDPKQGDAKEEESPPTIIGGKIENPISVDLGSDRNSGKDKIFYVDKQLDIIQKEVGSITITKENGCDNNIIGKITRAIQDFITIVNGLEGYIDAYVDPVLNTIIDITNEIKRTARIITGVIKFIINNFRSTIMKLVGDLFGKFIALVLPLPQHTPVAEATKNIMNIIFCIFEKLIDLLLDFLLDMLKGLVGRAINAPLCAAEQFTSAILSKLMDKIEELLEPVMSGLDWLLGGLSQIKGILSQVSSIANQILNFIGCDSLKCKTPSEWSLKFGPKRAGIDNWNNVLGNMNVLKGVNDNIDNALGSLSLYGYEGSVFRDCTKKVKTPKGQDDLTDTGKVYPYCVPPKIEIFGDGSGAKAVPIVSKDGSIISVKIINSGFGYSKPPRISIVDKTNHGSGAKASASISRGRITQIYLTRSGTGYCPPDLSSEFDIPSYLVTADRYTFFEGETVTYTIFTQNVKDNTSLSYMLGGDITSNDIEGSMNGSVTIKSNTAQVKVKIRQDSIQESVEQMFFDLQDTSGVIVARTIVNISNRLSPILTPIPDDPIQTPPGTPVSTGVGTFPKEIFDNVIPPGPGVGTDIVGIITSIVVENPGIGYSTGDVIQVGLCTFTPIVTPNGSIVGIQSITCANIFDALPNAIINSQNGEGADLYPVLEYLPQLSILPRVIINQVGILTVVDCV